MYKVFLVDDEIVIREGIRSNVQWDKHDFVLCGEAPDSEIALSMIQELKPDILITDIRMPFMDGLELCRRVTKTMPWMYIVIISGHDDFSYAQEAISLGVKEYLLKPIAANELEQVLVRIASDIARERAQQADLNALKSQLESSSKLVKESCLLSLLDGINGADVLKEARKLNINLLANYYIAMLAAVGDPSDTLRARGAMERYADGYGGTIHLCARAGQIAVLVMGDTEKDLEERAYAFAQAVQYGIERDGNIGLKVAIGAPVSSLSELPYSLKSASRVLQSMGGRNRIMGATDENTEIPAKALQSPTVPLYEQLRLADVSETPQIVRAHLDALGSAVVESMLMTNYVIMDIFLTASRIVNQSGGVSAELIPETERVPEILGSISSVEDIELIANSVLIRALNYRDEHAPGKHSATVRKACQYIESNYSKPEIMLHDVADHVALSNNHFCTVFSQEMGSTFIEYLTKLRMEKAKEYLKTTDISSGDIAERVGYNDPHYFRYLFKKNVGMNPRDYRASCRK